MGATEEWKEAGSFACLLTTREIKKDEMGSLLLDFATWGVTERTKRAYAV